MNWVSGVVVYTVLWWLVLFCVLPLGVRQAGTPEPGHDPGAPVEPRLGRKALLTTAIATGLFIVVWLIVRSPWLSFRE